MPNKKAGAPQTTRFIRECLADNHGEANTRTIHDYLINRTKQAPTMNELSALLGKSRYFESVGTEMCRAMMGGSYAVKGWAERIIL